MTIAEIRGRSKQLIGRIPVDLLVVAIPILTATASSGLGVLAGRGDSGGGGKGGGLWIEDMSANSTLPAAATASVPSLTAPSVGSGPYVVSKTGTKYYLATCGNAKKIKDTNRVYFASKAEAEAKGFTAASNCPGL